MPRLDRITIYPVKSFDGCELPASGFVEGGGLRDDRRFALFDDRGQIVNAKRFPEIQRLRCLFDLTQRRVDLTLPDRPRESFDLAAGDVRLQDRLSEYFGRRVELRENVDTGFPDDLNAAGPTVISVATLRRVSEWFGLDPAETRRRFRANLEIDELEPGDCPAFWEDRLFADDAAPDARDVVVFQIGDATLHGVNPCARCAVPTRDSLSTEVTPRFAVEFGNRRRDALPAWAPATAFDHFYRLAVNTRFGSAQGARTVRVGDVVRINAS